jgi:hypothetical protein
MSIANHPLMRAIRATWPDAEITIKRGTALTDPNEFERAAMEAASDRAGEFIDSLGRPDMSTWSPNQWRQFIEAICGGYVESLLVQQARLAGSVRNIET